MEKEIGEKYLTKVSYTDNFEYHNPERDLKRTEKYLQKDSLYIFFESYFDSDTINVKVTNHLDKILYLTTDESMGLADGIFYGDIHSIDRISVTKNNGKSLIIELSDKNMNIWAVRFYRDTLFAQRMKYLPYYE